MSNDKKTLVKDPRMVTPGDRFKGKYKSRVNGVQQFAEVEGEIYRAGDKMYVAGSPITRKTKDGEIVWDTTYFTITEIVRRDPYKFWQELPNGTIIRQEGFGIYVKASSSSSEDTAPWLVVPFNSSGKNSASEVEWLGNEDLIDELEGFPWTVDVPE